MGEGRNVLVSPLSTMLKTGVAPMLSVQLRLPCANHSAAVQSPRATSSTCTVCVRRSLLQSHFISSSM